MNKKVLLARPNPFIVNEMHKFISSCNYQPQPLGALSELKRYKKEELAGIVISTAINSDVKDSFNDTLKSVMDTYSDIPILIATLIPAKKIKALTDNFLNHIGINYTVKSIEAIDLNATLELKNTLIIIEKSVLTDDKKEIHCKKIIQDFFN